MPIASVTDFFEEIIRDLHTSLYLALGGSIDEESLNWSSQAVELASTGIKILILLAVLGFFYWLANYILRQSRAKIRLNERRTKIVRWNHTVQFFSIITWRTWCNLIRNVFCRTIEMTDDITSD